MGCIWSSKLPPKHCLVCHCEQTVEAGFINNKCRSCVLEQISRSRTIQYSENTYTFVRASVPNVVRSNVRGVLPQPRPNVINNEPQFGRYVCKSCGRSWKSIRSWSNKYQMCKRCKIPVYPHKLREILSSDYVTTKEESKEHERELCQMCKQLGYSCKNYSKSTNER